MNIKLRVIPVIFLLISACDPGFDGSLATQIQNSSGDKKDDTFYNEVCYNSGIDSCHGLTHEHNLITPEDYNYPDNNSPQYRKPDYFIDLTVEGSNLYVSPNFTRDEYLSLFKGRYGILSPLLVEKVQNIRNAISQPIKVNSAYRNPTYNESVGGAQFSRHMYGDAIDFKANGIPQSELKTFCEEQGASYIQVYTGHVHCDWRYESLPEEFYPEQGPPIGNAQKNKLKKNLHDNFLETVKVNISGVTRAGNTIKVFVTSKGSEESESELSRYWKVSKNGQIIQENSQTEVSLNLEQGTYDIQVELGGYWKKTKSITVE